MRGGFAYVAFALGLATAGGAAADPRLDEVVYDPYVQNGVFELEARGARALGGPIGGATTTVLEGEYGVNDRLSLAVVATMDRPAGQTNHLSAVGLEGVYYLGQVPKLGVDAGLYVEYTRGLKGEDDVAEAKLLLARTVGRFQALVNLVVEEPIGAPAGQGYAAYGFAASVTVETWGRLRMGAEAFGDLGNDHAFLGRQGAYVGPQLKWEGRLGRLPFDLGVDAGWLAAVGTSRLEAGGEARLALELEHRF